jgi:paraquat-inducible protein A
MDSPPSITRPHLIECHDCGTIQRLPAMPAKTRAVCPVCDAHLRHTRVDPFSLPLALNLAALIMLVIGVFFTLLSVSTGGQFRNANLLTGPDRLWGFGLWELSLVVLITTFAAPLLRILCMIAVLGGLHLEHRPPGIRGAFAWVERLRPWSMVEIFLLGLFVAYVRLSAIARIDLGPAIVALAVLSVTMLIADISMDSQAVWEALDAHKPRRPSHHPPASLLGFRLHRMGCDTCRRVTRGREGTLCPRCGFPLHHRKTDSIARTWALVIASVILYIPANVYPVLTVVRFGSGEPSTILQGVRELMEADEWPLAILVFFASVTVPVLKLVSLILLLVTTMAGVRTHRRDRTVLYRIIDAVGRWSMIDIFMESILVALVQFGAVVTILPGPGAIAFATVVILTMFAARTFDPRLLWDRAREAADRPVASLEPASLKPT